MDTIIHFKADFECVYLINGVFFESAKAVKYPSNKVMYMTVLPLRAQLLPYTVKFTGDTPSTNQELTVCYTLTQTECFVKLKPRYNYVYSPITDVNYNSNSLPVKFFSEVKKGNVDNARAMMTDTLNANIDNDNLRGFFDDYADIVDGEGITAANCCYLISREGKGSMFDFIIIDGRIDDIIEHKE